MPAPGARGLAEIRDGQSNTQIIAILIGLKAESGHRLVASTKPCDRIHRAANTLASHSFESDVNGTAFVDALFVDGIAQDVRSLRVMRGSTQVECRRGFQYTSAEAAAFLPQDALAVGIWDDTDIVHGMVMVGLGDGNDELALALAALDPGRTYRLVGSDAGCAQAPSASHRVFRYDFSASARGTGYGLASIGDLAAAPESVHLKARNGSKYIAVACAEMEYGSFGELPRA
jgi:hypothetical protein